MELLLDDAEHVLFTEDQVLIGGVGRLEPVKGFNYFVEMARQLREKDPSLKFMIAGDGALAIVVE